MGWPIVLLIPIIKIIYQSLRCSPKSVIRFPYEFVEVINIIEDTPGAFIHYPKRTAHHLYEVNFDVSIYAGKSKGTARLDFKEKEFVIQISYPLPIPKKYLFECFEFTALVNENINDRLWHLQIDFKNKLFIFVFRSDFEPGICVLPPYSDHILRYAIMQINKYQRGILKLIFEGMEAEEALIYCGKSSVLTI